MAINYENPYTTYQGIPIYMGTEEETGDTIYSTGRSSGIPYHQLDQLQKSITARGAEGYYGGDYSGPGASQEPTWEETEAARKAAGGMGMRVQGAEDPWGGRAPDVWTPLNEDYTLPEHLQIQNQYDDSYMKGLADYAYGGDSPWLTSMLEQQDLEEQGLLESSEQQLSAQLANARDQLAMRGGASSGAAERMGAMGAGQLMRTQQGVGLQGALQRAQLRQAEQEQKMAVKTSLPGMSLAGAQYGSEVNRVNIANVLGQASDFEKRKQEPYLAKLQYQAAKDESNAMLEANKPGFVGKILGDIGSIFKI